ncbi:hypothetical protein D770_00525 [Flammeovirgaceae bacterium 311]|nr:hypothetical protein D770_00525 [Flammeovirgaceae bacterium 311]
MRTSLNNIRQTEAFLHAQLPPQEAILFEARLLTDPLLRLNLRLQQKAYSLIRMYYRKKLKEEVSDVHEQLYNDPQQSAFKQQIQQLFKS